MVKVDLRTKHKLADRVHDYLRAAILNGELDPGSRIVEAHLAERLSVSRSPVREAVSRLEQEGLVVVDGLRVMVREMPPEELDELLWLRCALEGLAALLATPKLTSEDLQAMSDSCTSMESALAGGDFPALSSLGRQFDEVFLAACGNLRLQRSLKEVKEYIERFRWVSAAQPGRAPEVVREHRAVLEAFQAGDGAEAERRVRAHILSARRSLLGNEAKR